MNKIILFTCLYLLIVLPGSGQNTATTTGLWSACTTWGSPAYIYKNATDTKTINNGVTVTLDQNWSTGAIALNTSGAVGLNSGVFIDFNTSQGADVGCAQTYSETLASSGPVFSAGNPAAVSVYSLNNGTSNFGAASSNVSGGNFTAPTTGVYVFTSTVAVTAVYGSADCSCGYIQLSYFGYGSLWTNCAGYTSVTVSLTQGQQLPLSFYSQSAIGGSCGNAQSNIEMINCYVYVRLQ